MNNDLKELLNEIHRLQDEAENQWDKLREQFNYTLEGHKVRFAKEVKRLHLRYRTGTLRYLLTANPLHLVTVPVIYSMIVPIVFLDACITVYQHICFRAYSLPRVSHRDYIIFDHHQLSYLNIIEKFNCIYCSYGNGFIAYAREIIARTEQYWCPIKHAQRILDAHEHYADFAEYGDAEHYQTKLVALRKALADIQRKDEV